MTKNEQNVTGARSPRQVAADLFRIGENPGLPAWQYPALQEAIELLGAPVEREALSKLRAEMFDWLASCTNEHIDGKIEFINRVTDGLALIYAPVSSADRIEANGFTYASKQATACAGCGQHKHTPLRIDRTGGYVCLTCIDRELERVVTLADDQRAAVEFALGACAGHIAGERHVSALESLLSGVREAR